MTTSAANECSRLRVRDEVPRRRIRNTPERPDVSGVLGRVSNSCSTKSVAATEISDFKRARPEPVRSWRKSTGKAGRGVQGRAARGPRPSGALAALGADRRAAVRSQSDARRLVRSDSRKLVPNTNAGSRKEAFPRAAGISRKHAMTPMERVLCPSGLAEVEEHSRSFFFFRPP